MPPAPAGGGYEDSGETSLLLTTNPAADYQATAEVFGSVPPGGAEQSIGDWFSTAINGAKDAVRVLSYSIMKARAGRSARPGSDRCSPRCTPSHPGSGCT